MKDARLVVHSLYCSHVKKQATLAAANTDVTITINAHGEVNVDQAAIASVLGSGQQSAKVTFVRC